jgi:hypothetical protein
MNKSCKPLPARSLIRATFDYSPDTGILTWKPRKVRQSHHRFDNGFNTQFAGKPTGCPNGLGYLRVLWNGQHYVAHRLIWKWVHGTDAPMLDHINGDKADNRIANLRECTRSQNNTNIKARAISGYKGVSKTRAGRWAATIRKDKIATHLGTFESAELAHDAYCRAAMVAHGEYFNSGST